MKFGPIHFLTFIHAVLSSSSNPLVSDSHIDGIIGSNNYISNDAKNYHKQDPFSHDEETSQWKMSDTDRIIDDSECQVKLNQKWTTKVSDVVLSSPTVYSAFINGKKQLLAFTMRRYIELLDESGMKPYGWPMGLRNHKFFSSPLLHDIDNDGKEDVCAISFDGLIAWIKVGDFGQHLDQFTIHLPGLFVKKNWFERLNETMTDQQMMYGVNHAGFSYFGQTEEEDVKDSLLSIDGHLSYKRIQPIKSNSSKPIEPIPPLPEVHRRLQEEEEATGSDDVFSPSSLSTGPSAQDYNYHHYGGGPEHYAYYGYGHRNMHREPAVNESDMVLLDAHVLASGVLVDVNGDGEMEIIVPVSYFFDSLEYPINELGPNGVNVSYYVAGGVSCYSVSTRALWWNVHLDLTTDLTRFRAYIHNTPVLADVDGDFRIDVIVGTSLGLLYVLDSYNGQCKFPFPLQFGEIEAPVAVADVADTSDLEIIVGDMNGNLVCVSSNGIVIWDRKLHGPITQSPTVGDIDSDGNLDVVVAVTDTKGSILIFAVDGATGMDLLNYPLLLKTSEVDHYPISSVVLKDFHSYGNGELSPSSSGSGVSLDVLQGISSAYLASEWDELTRKIIDSTSNDISVPFLFGSTSKYFRGGEPAIQHHHTATDTAGINATEKINDFRYGDDDDFVNWKARSASLASFQTFITAMGRKMNGNDYKLIDPDNHDKITMLRSGQWINKFLKDVAMSIKLSKHADARSHPLLTMESLGSILSDIAVSSSRFDGSGSTGKGLHLLLTTHNGHMYLIDGKSLCHQDFKLSHHQCSPPVIDDLDNDGYYDVVLSTCSSEIVTMSTDTATSTSIFQHAQSVLGLNVISPSNGLNNYVSRVMNLEFEIVDNRLNIHSKERAYHVTLTSGRNGERVLLLDKTYETTGLQKEVVKLALSVGKSELVLEMKSDHGQTIFSKIQVNINIPMDFVVWIAVACSTIVLLPLVALSRSKQDGKQETLH